MKTPVLFIVYNRPELSSRVFESIRSVQPPRLYIAADGPKHSASMHDIERCLQVRELARAIDWDCKLFTRFSDHNLGCKAAESSAMDWFFENEEAGIILEDDTLPNSSFYDYCEEMLAAFKDEDSVMSISGNSYVSHIVPTTSSYRLSNMACYWGWASWRRSWKKYDVLMKEWPEWSKSSDLSRISGGNLAFVRYWTSIFEQTYREQIDTWDFQMVFAMWKTQAMTVMPTVNMVENIGFGKDATHTIGPIPKWLLEAPLAEMAFPLIHPKQSLPDSTFDRIFAERVFGIKSETSPTISKEVRSV